MTGTLHPDEHAVDVRLVRMLVDVALPAYSSLPLTPMRASGSSNALFRLGEELLVRVPRQPGGSADIEKEARWLPWVAPALPVAVPEVVAVGAPAHGYPERWSVVRWMDGTMPPVAGSAPEAGRERRDLALDLADVAVALRRLAVPACVREDPALASYRGDPLGRLDARTRTDIEACRTVSDLDLDLDAALWVWEEAMDLPGAWQSTAPHWYHGDLLAENLLVDGGRLAAVLDFGGLAVGDPAVDLMVAWEVLDAGSREVFRVALGVGEESWLLGRAWALAVALMTFPYYWRTMPARCADRLAMARAVIADARPWNLVAGFASRSRSRSPVAPVEVAQELLVVVGRDHARNGPR